MRYGDEHLAGEADLPVTHGESMDVLLQLTLPIVLILAFLVVTEVQTLSDQIGRLKRDIENTATGRLSRERDTTLMELQLQLLYQATDQVAQSEEETLALREYGLVAPGAEDILAARVDERFATTSRRLQELLGGEERRERSEVRLRTAVEGRFAELVATELGEFESDARTRILSIPDAHRKLYETKLQGYLERFEKLGAAVQLDVMLSWIEDPAVGGLLRPDSLSLWRRIQRGLVSGEPGEVPFDEFVNLGTARLVEELQALNIPLLDRSIREARL